MNTLCLSRPLRSLLLPLPLSLLLLAQSGCGSDGSSSSATKHPGTEGGACDNGSCDDGLECLSNVCVDPKSGSSGSTGAGGGSASGGSNGSGGASSVSGSGSDAGGAGGAGDTSGDATSDGAGGAVDSSGGSGGAAADSSGGSTGTSTDGAAGEGGDVVCEGTHPNVNGQARTCDEGSCYCAGDPVDTCFSKDTVDACCDGMIRCANDSQPAGVDCAGQHPIVTDQARTCEPGSCLCSDGVSVDKCLAEDVARICCPSDIELDCVPAG